ncbi:MAG: hypothetical protein COS89_05455, partial [Deltaproteobacteria bacterium CG07_land_8_20_14_0_80_38_7]
MLGAELKQNIKQAIESFSKENLTEKSLNLFQVLGYKTKRQFHLSNPTFSEFKECYIESPSAFNEKKALVSEWNYVDLLFQLSEEEIHNQLSFFSTEKVDNTIIESYLFFVIGLTKPQYTRTELSQITREVNKLFKMPAMLLFKYGNNLTLSIIDRRLNEKDESKDVLKKVTLIKDIDINKPHRGHIEILFDLSFDELLRIHNFTNFVDLHNAWKKTLDTKELNKKFYKELSNWYFWAMDNVSFPDDIEKSKNIRNATSLIRLITRIIFIWFIKEKDLIPENLFDCKELGRILKEFLKNRKSKSYYMAILQNLF